MKHLICCLALGAALLMGMAGCAQAPAAEPAATPIPATPTSALPPEVQNLHWFGISGFLYHGTQNVYFDPVNVEGDLPAADLILITHAHNDHYSVADLLQIIGPETVLVISPNVTTAYEQTQDELGIAATVLAAGESAEVNGITVEAVPAFDARFHPLAGGGVGYIVTVDGLRLYHAGGTYSYPEMAGYQCDVALIPMYDQDDLRIMAELIPAKVIVVDHTSYYTALALDKLIGQELGSEKVFVPLEGGPYQP